MINKEEFAKTKDEMQPDGKYQMSGNKIIVRTLDLYQSFAEIRKELDGIVTEHF
jgi:5-methylcytosine-specific restriction enzyme subunit McrC